MTGTQYTNTSDQEKKLRGCSFCYRDENTVSRLVAGPNNIFICNYCITLSVDLLIHHAEMDMAELRKRQVKVIQFHPETEPERKDA